MVREFLNYALIFPQLLKSDYPTGRDNSLNRNGLFSPIKARGRVAKHLAGRRPGLSYLGPRD